MTKLALLNTSILTTAGAYELTDITLDQARQMVADNADNLDSAVGHQATADIMTALLDIDIPSTGSYLCRRFTRKLVFKLGAAAGRNTWQRISKKSVINSRFLSAPGNKGGSCRPKQAQLPTHYRRIYYIIAAFSKTRRNYENFTDQRNSEGIFP
ncbi:MAG: STIV orfB116 family protein [Eisenbergiella massiliensis]